MNNTFIYEIKRFFKFNIKNIIIGSVIVSVLYVIFQLLLGHFFPINNELVEETERELTVENVRPAYSQFYIENEDGSVFTNTSLILNYLFLPEVIDDLESETSVNFEDILEESGLRGELNDEEIRQEAFYLYRDHAASTYNFFIQLGDEQDNLAVMNYFYDLIVNRDIPILENRFVYEIVSPEVKITDLEETQEESSAIDDRAFINVILDAVIGFLMGIVGLIVFLMLRAIVSNKLNYSFSYERELQDLFLLYDENYSDESELNNFVLQPIKKKAIISQYDTNEKVRILIADSYESELYTKNQITQNQSLTEVDPAFIIDEVIIIIQGGKTGKNWYKKQRRLIKNTPARVKVLHYNESI